MKSRLENLRWKFAQQANLVVKVLEIADVEALQVHRQASTLSGSLHEQLGDLAQDLILRIRVAQAHCRGSMFHHEYAVSYFGEVSTQIIEEARRLSNILGEDRFAEVERFAASYPALAVAGNAERLRKLREFSAGVDCVPLVFLRTSTLRRRAAESFSNKEPEDFSILRDLKSFMVSENLRDARIVIIGAPVQLASYPQLAKYFRAWFTEGSVSAIEFMAPNWAPQSSAQEFSSFVFAGLPWKGLADFEIEMAPPASSEIQRVSTGEFVLPEDSVVGEYDPDKNGLERISLGGEIDCLLVKCGGGLVFPVQVGSSTVTGIAISELESLSPAVTELQLTKLEKGDVITARADSSEQLALRARVLKRIGHTGDEFIRRQNGWKGLLREKKANGDWLDVTRLLGDSRLSVSPRLSYWAEDLSFGPRSGDDFVRLLEFLGISRENAMNALSVRNLVWAESIREGQLVRSILQNSLSDEHLEVLRLGRSVVIENSDLGDANYIFSPVEEILTPPTKVKSTQIRKFVAQ